MRSSTYTRVELVRNLRNRRFLLFSLGFPLVLYVLIATPNRHEESLGGSGIPAPLYFMVSLAAFGTMNAVVGAGGRIALERTIGWTRQLRLTPLSARAYIGAKVAVAYATALLTIVVLFAAGSALGVSLSAAHWLEMTGLILVGLLPFAALGIGLGHLVGVDALGPAVGGLTALLAFLGGVWFPLGDGVMHDIAQALPSYWLVQASHVALGGAGWGATGWLVVAAWTAALSLVAAFAWRRDTKRA
jgi:ABC-2 type transport system permease protein